MNPPSLSHTAEDLQRLESAVSAPPEFLSDQRKRQLRILLALCRGESVAAIAKAENNLSEQRVRDIRKKALELGLTAEIDRLTANPQKAKAQKTGKRAHAGRPGHETFDQRAAAFKAEDEPIFELSTLLIFPDLQVASFSVRLGRNEDCGAEEKGEGNSASEAEKQQKADERELQQELRVLHKLTLLASEIECVSDEPVVWTEVSNLDDILAQLFATLVRGLDCMQPPADDRPISCSQLHTRFSKRFGHVILSSGPKDQVQNIVTQLKGKAVARHVQASTELGFLSHLESVLYQRRMKASCIGFLPAAWYAYNEANRWFESAFKGPFVWQVGELDIHTCLQRHVVISEYFAVHGALFEMSSVLWRKLLYQDDIPYASISHRTRVEVVQHLPESNLVRLSIGPLPEYTYSVDVPLEGSPDDLAQSLRKRVNETPAARRMIYSTRSDGKRVRFSVVLPSDFFANNNDVEAGDGFGVVLFPRHFLSYRPPVDLKQLVAWAREPKPEIREETALIDSIEERCCIFNPRIVLFSIGQRFEENRYGDRLRQFSELQGRLLKLSLGRLTEEDDLWLPHFMKLNPGMPTFYYFDEACLRREVQTPEVEARLADFVKHNIPPSDDDRPWIEYRPPRTDRPNPDELQYCFKEQFANLLHNMDADFLMFGCDAETRAEVDQLTARGRTEMERILTDEYWPRGKLDSKKVVSLVSASLHEKYDMRKEEVDDWTLRALRTFLENCRYVIRGAVENMQRLSLAGLPPYPIFVETRSESLARWKALLGRTLNARLSRDDEPKPATTGAVNMENIPSHSSGLEAQAGEINEIVDAIMGVIEVSPSQLAFVRFYNYALDYEDELWDDAVGCLEEKFGPDFKARLSEAVELCRAYPAADPHSSSLPATIERLLRQFA
jgi:hypothetical protein